MFMLGAVLATLPRRYFCSTPMERCGYEKLTAI
jgi:hypothetical protein